VVARVSMDVACCELWLRRDANCAGSNNKLTESRVRRNSWRGIVTVCSAAFLSALGSRGRWPAMVGGDGEVFAMGSAVVMGGRGRLKLGSEGRKRWRVPGGLKENRTLGFSALPSNTQRHILNPSVWAARPNAPASRTSAWPQIRTT
jgi:hypothetical protein